MPKPRTHFLCRQCGSVQSRWMGKCPDCGAWDALEKYHEPKDAAPAADHAAAVTTWTTDGDGDATGGASAPANARATPLPAVQTADVQRLPTGIGEFDRVLGGGLVPGSVTLLGGDPGIGKSTLLLQAAGRLAAHDRRVLYVTSEESAYQTRLRAERLFPDTSAAAKADAANPPRLDDLDDLFILAETNLARVVEQARQARPAVMVLDSIQMVYKPDVAAAPGSIAQLRRCCTDLVYLAKVSGMAIVLVGHVTKAGQFAGPKLLEHLVDAVLSFEGDRHHAHRVVRGVKNRYGTTLEVGLFEMAEHGLREVAEATGLLDPTGEPQSGSVVCPVMHGSRCLMLELQALTAAGFLGSAKRKVSGVDGNRLAMLIAVLEKHGGLRLADQDVFASAVSGLRVAEPAADLALCLAVAGAHYSRTLPAGVAVVGEVGLGGEIRRVPAAEQRLNAAMRLGFERLILPAANAPDLGRDSGRTITVRRLGDALALLEPARRSATVSAPAAAASGA